MNTFITLVILVGVGYGIYKVVTKDDNNGSGGAGGGSGGGDDGNPRPK